VTGCFDLLLGLESEGGRCVEGIFDRRKKQIIDFNLLSAVAVAVAVVAAAAAAAVVS
jgi:hypothetical protein